MCLEQLVETGSLVKKCKTDSHGNKIAYKIVRRFPDKLTSPFKENLISIGMNNKCWSTRSLKEKSVKPVGFISDTSVEIRERSTYPLGYHVYALKKDAQIALNEIKRLLKKGIAPTYTDRDANSYCIIPVSFNPNDKSVLAEGIEDYLNNSHWGVIPNDANPTQFVIVLRRYIVKKEDYDKALSKKV